MDRLSIYLEIVPLPVILGAVVIAVVIALAIPAAARLPFGLIVLPVWLTLGRLPDLGSVQPLTKTTGFLAIAYVGFAALSHKGPRRRLPAIVWIYPVMTFLSMAWTISAPPGDRPLRFVLNFQWFLLATSAVLLAQTVVTAADLRRVLRSMAIGLAIALSVVFAQIILSPTTIFRAGIGRFEPWGANANQIGTLFLLGFPLLAFFGMRGRSPHWRLMSLGFAGMAALMGVLTASRSVIFPLVLISGVLGWEFRRKPLAIVGGVVAVAVALYAGSSVVAGANLERVGSLETERYSIAETYLGFIMEHPIFGRLMVDHAVARPDETHAHNAYLQLLYEYGFSFGIPLFGLAGLGMLGALKCWKNKDRMAIETFDITLLIGFIGIAYLHGLTTIVIYYPTYTWCFFLVFITTLFISFGKDPVNALAWPEDAAYSEWDDDERDEQHHDESLDQPGDSAYPGYEDYGDPRLGPAV